MTKAEMVKTPHGWVEPAHLLWAKGKEFAESPIYREQDKLTVIVPDYPFFDSDWRPKNVRCSVYDDDYRPKDQSRCSLYHATLWRVIWIWKFTSVSFSLILLGLHSRYRRYLG